MVLTFASNMIKFIMKTEKGKPVARWGRKAAGLMVHCFECGDSRAYRTRNYACLLPREDYEIAELPKRRLRKVTMVQ